MESITSYRTQIDYIDSRILFFLKERMILSKRIAVKKKFEKKQVLDQDRENHIIQSLLLQNKNDKSDKFKLDEIFIKKIWNLIMDYSKLIQKTNLG
tara:strand:- start:353 stop:640 length:288 start_codon:yes stop_codon:yes gene_type:complete